jgi:mono/diheme cytochrome c family protein
MPEETRVRHGEGNPGEKIAPSLAGLVRLTRPEYQARACHLSFVPDKTPTLPMNRPLITATLICTSVLSASAVDYTKEIKPIFSQKCYACHAVSKGKTKGDVALDTPEKLAEVIAPGGHVVAGAPEKSTLLISCKLPDDDDEVMPPKGKNRLTPAEITALETWIKEGASLIAGGAAPAAAPTAAAPATGGAQNWTSSDGKVIQATFAGMKDGAVLLKLASSGEVFQVPLTRLSAESQAQAKAAAGQ